jgi:putative ABC transport system ATP-binding protein
VAIARALFFRPKVILCDEPTGNLDARTGAEVIDFFVRLAKDDKQTLVVVTHEERVSRAAGRVLRLREGRLVEGAEVSP